MLLPAQSGDSPYVIRDVRVFDGETVAERQIVLISQGTIAAAGGIDIAVRNIVAIWKSGVRVQPAP